MNRLETSSKNVREFLRELLHNFFEIIGVEEWKPLTFLNLKLIFNGQIILLILYKIKKKTFNRLTGCTHFSIDFSSNFNWIKRFFKRSILYITLRLFVECKNKTNIAVSHILDTWIKSKQIIFDKLYLSYTGKFLREKELEQNCHINALKNAAK